MFRTIIIACLTATALSVPMAAYGKLLDGDSQYTTPTAPLEIRNSQDFSAPFDTTWRALVSHLSETSFVIDNIDKASGLITLSFSVPEAGSALDCGQWSLWVKNLRGRRDYAYAGAADFARYEAVNAGNLYTHERRMTLSGKMNIFATALDDTSTRVKVTVRYVPAISMTASTFELDMNFNRRPPQTVNDTSSFNTGQEGQFTHGLTTCRAKGTLERSLLDSIAATLAP